MIRLLWVLVFIYLVVCFRVVGGVFLVQDFCLFQGLVYIVQNLERLYFIQFVGVDGLFTYVYWQLELVVIFLNIVGKVYGLDVTFRIFRVRGVRLLG